MYFFSDIVGVYVTKGGFCTAVRVASCVSERGRKEKALYAIVGDKWELNEGKKNNNDTVASIHIVPILQNPPYILATARDTSAPPLVALSRHTPPPTSVEATDDRRLRTSQRATVSS